ncbi:MAG: NADH:flavin oxidoreductase/NADH oxidase [Rhodospirillales bacterium]|nr:MAG: NADH:flavin oxidoreductase/NADH oxidase [Rhodospirillales bacterium]
MSALFSPLALRSLTLRNRVVMSPMCQYSAVDGAAQPWHLVHLGARALGGVAAVMTEATAVTPEGRLSPQDLGIWSDDHVAGLREVVDFIRGHGAVAGIQLAHGGRKGARFRPWEGNGPLDRDREWPLLGPSAMAFDEGWQAPREMDESAILRTVDAFRAATRRALRAGFQIVEGHFAHGYLLHSFLSPLSNNRRDQYGGTLENRARFPLMVARALREEWPEHLPVFIRLSVIDWVEGGLDLGQSVQIALWLKEVGIDLVDCSSGAVVPREAADVAPGYQVPFAMEIRRKADISTGAVGLITEPSQAEAIIASGSADLVFLGRALLRDPNWAAKAKEELDGDPEWPIQYARAVARSRGRTAW